MAEFVEKRVEDMIPELEQMERIKLFEKNEIRAIAKKYKEFEYKIQRHTKSREDYEQYIRYKLNLLALIKQRRRKYGMLKKKSDIDYTIANKINNLYKTAISKFNDIGLWLDYITFCKEVHFYSTISYMLDKMLQVHGDKPRCWHIAACWELEENNDKRKARHYLLRGLNIHSNSQLLYMQAFRLELDDLDVTVSNNTENTEDQEDNPALTVEDDEMPLSLSKAYVIYQQAFEHINNVEFIIKLLTITEEYNNTEKLQKRILSDIIQTYSHEALVWDKVAHRELKGLVQPGLTDTLTELNDLGETPLRDRITSCNKVYQTALKDINTEEMWSLYIECLLDMNKDLQLLPNFKRKLLKTALMQAHQAKKLTEKHYLCWVDMLSAKADDENAQMKLCQVLCEATDAIPNSVILWHARLKHLLVSGLEKEANAIYPKATEILGEKALPLWKMRIWHVQTKNPEKIEEAYQAALQAHPFVARDLKPPYIEWLALTKGIDAARKAYESLYLQPPLSPELHRKMASLEVMQPNVSVKHARRPYELATHLFGRKDKSIWMDYIKFEWKYGEPWDGGRIYDRALRSLDGSLTASFIEDFISMKLALDDTNDRSVETDTDAESE